MQTGSLNDQTRTDVLRAIINVECDIGARCKANRCLRERRRRKQETRECGGELHLSVESGYSFTKPQGSAGTMYKAVFIMYRLELASHMITRSVPSNSQARCDDVVLLPRGVIVVR
jgi:hypothetical protein